VECAPEAINTIATPAPIQLQAQWVASPATAFGLYATFNGAAQFAVAGKVWSAAVAGFPLEQVAGFGLDWRVQWNTQPEGGLAP
jgi:hypothetical protein